MTDGPVGGAPVWAVVLAAGESGRFGSPKALMPVGDGTALETIVATARSAGVAGVIVVTGFHREEVARIAARCGAIERANADPARGMMSSVREGVSALPSGVDALVWPVDHPFVTAGTVIRVLEARSPAGRMRPIVVPARAGRGGHPTLFPADLRPAILSLDDSGGLNRLLAAHPERVLRLEVPDDGVLADVDWPADLPDRRVSQGKPLIR